MDRRPLWRRVRIDRMLRHRGHVQPHELVERGVCRDKRQARDDLQALEAAGLGVAREGEGQATRYVLSEDLRRLGLRLKLEDVLGLEFGRALLEGLLGGTAFETSVDSLSARLRDAGPDELRTDSAIDRRFVVVHEPRKDYRDHEPTLKALAQAVLHNHPIDVTYRRPNGTTKTYAFVEPLTLVFYKGGVYLAFERRDRWMTLPVERIQALTPHTDRTFRYPTPSEYDPHAYLEGRFGLFAAPETAPPSKVRIAFTSKVRSLVERRTWGPEQTVRPTPDGGCELTFTTGGLELVSWVLEWGPQARVLEPAWLRDRVARELREALEHYASFEN